MFKKRKGCKYCRRRLPIVDNENLELRIAYYNELTFNFNGKSEVKKINYCPMCGRKLMSYL